MSRFSFLWAGLGLASCLLVASPSAQAQYPQSNLPLLDAAWRPSVEYSGKTEGLGINIGPNGPVYQFFSFPWGKDNVNQWSGAAAGSQVAGINTSVRLDGTITYLYRWANSNGSLAPNPPTVMYVRKYLRAEAEAGGKPQVTVEVFTGVPGTLYSASDYGYQYYELTSERVERVSVADGTVRIPMQVRAQASAQPEYPGDASYAMGHVSAWAELHYPLHVVHDGWGPTYRKGPNYTQLLNERKPDGSIDADTVMTYRDEVTYLSSPTSPAIPVIINYWYMDRRVIGGQDIYSDADYTIAWNGPGDFQDLFAPSPGKFHFSVRLPEQTTLPQSGSLFIAATDKDNADNPTLINNMKITFHMPYENWKVERQNSIWEEVPCESTIAYPNGSSSVTYTIGDPLWTGVASKLPAAFGVISAGLYEFPPYAALFAVAGVAAQELGPKPGPPQVVPFNQAWEDSTSTFSPPKDASQRYLYVMTATLEMGYTLTICKGDEYNDNGYAGACWAGVRKHDGRKRLVAHFEIPPMQ